MMLVLKVTIPACEAHKCERDKIAENSHHLYGATEGQLNSVRSDHRRTDRI